MKLKPAGTQTFEYFADENGNMYSRDGNGYWEVQGEKGFYQSCTNAEHQALRYAYEELKAKQ